jgi:hypothetical protein
MKITLTKAGKNIRISFDPTETTQPDMLEDSANVEVTYQNLNNNVTVSISGGANFQTGNITTGTFLYMDSGSGPVLINSKALFLTNYPLVFPSGGGGPVTTPNIDQVLAQGGSLTANRLIDTVGNTLSIFDSGTSFPFNEFVFDTQNLILKTPVSNLEFTNGVKITNNAGTSTNAIFNLSNNSVSIGDITNTYNGSTLNVSFSLLTLTKNTIANGIQVDYLGTSQIGDFSNLTLGGIYLDIQQGAGYFRTNGGGVARGINLDMLANKHQLGDFQNQSNGTLFDVDITNALIYTSFSTTINGLILDFSNRSFNFGDFAGIFNSTAILIEDTANEMVLQNSQTTGFTEIKSNQLKFTGANLESNTASGNSGQHLVINLNGVTYHIKLENP